MSRKPKYFDNIKSHSTLERAVMEFIIPRRWGQKWADLAVDKEP